MIFPALKPIWYQLPSWYARSKGVRFEINSIHRRGGKDVHHFSMAVQDAIEHGGVHYYAFPTRKWAEDAIFDEQFTVDGDTRYFWEWIIPRQMKPIRKEKDSCIVLKNNARIQLCGTDDGTFVGRGGKGYTLSEFSLHKNDVTAFIAPIIQQSGGYLRMNGTLRGRDNHLWKMIQANTNNPDWFVQWLRPQNTKCYCWVGSGMNINPELLDKIGQLAPNYSRIFNVQDLIDSRVTSYNKALQEFVNEPTMMIENGYYQYEMSIAKGENRLGNKNIKYDPSKPVFTFWDLGLGTSHNSTDAMSIWFAQVPNEDYINPKQVNLIDYYEMRGRDWSHYAQILNSKGYWYGNHYAPWDIAKGMAGHDKTNKDYARERGIQFQTVRRGQKLMMDIEECRRFFPAVWSGCNEQVVNGIELLMSYHEKLDGNGVGTGKPEHDASSNCADSFRSMVRSFSTGIVYPNLGQNNDWEKDLKFEGYFE